MATPAQLRGINRRRILAALLRRGEASRAELAQITGLSRPTAGHIADDLLEAGLLEEAGAPDPAAGAAPPRPGRPGQLLRLDRSRPRIAAVEIGVRRTRLALLPVGLPPGPDRWPLEWPTGETPEAWARGLAAAARRLSPHRVEAVLLSVPGVVDETAGRVLYSPNLHWTEGTHLLSLVGRVWDAPARLLQEIRALALGQMAVEPDGGDFLLVDFEDGVGGAAVVGGALFTGPLPLSGELGHMPVPGNRRPCGCGGTGCLETLASRPGLLRSFAARRKGKDHDWPALVRDTATRGIRPWLAATLEAVASAVAGALNILGLRRVVLTGCLTELPETALEHLRRAVIGGTMWARFGDVSCQAAPRRRMAGLVWAALDRLLVPAPPETSPEDLSSLRKIPSPVLEARP